MTAANVDPDRPGSDSGLRRPAPTRWRTISGVAFGLLAVALAGYAISEDRDSFEHALRSIGPVSVALSLLLGLAGIATTFPVWRAVVRGLGVDMPLAAGSRVFFLSQLGKYLPGSVWPVVMQMEAGRARGASRRTMLAANLITVAISCSVGLLLACLLLPFFDATALRHYWWALLAVPFLLAALHPRSLPGLLDRAFALVHRLPLNERLEFQALGRAAGWSVASWLSFGLQIGVLTSALGHRGLSVYLLSIGAMSLAVPLGILFIPAPAGAGVRDVVLVFVLKTSLTSGQALAVVVVSRVLLICGDLILAGISWVRVRQMGEVDPT